MSESVFDTDKRKVFPLHTDQYQFQTDFRAVGAVIEEIHEREAESGLEALQKYGALNERPESKTLFHKAVNSFNDPISVYFVLDALVTSERATYLRPSYLVAYLRRQVPQFKWTIGVVGRILAGFNAMAEELYLVDSDEHIVADDSDAAKRLLPFAQARDSQSRFYVIDPEGGDEGLLWLMQCRKIWLDLALQSMEDDDRNQPKANWGNEYSPAEYYMNHIEEPARNAVAYRAQLGGAQTYRGYRPQRREDG